MSVNTRYYCKTCKYDLCPQCKESHFFDLDTICHDVVIYPSIIVEETCTKHPEKIYVLYCIWCGLPSCVMREEHKNHNTIDIKTAHKTYLQQERDIFNNLRSDILFNRCHLLTGIKSDLNICHTEISNVRSQMSKKAKRLKRLIDTIILDIKIERKSFICKTQQQIRKMVSYLAFIEKYHCINEQSVKRSVKFLLFLKKTYVPKIEVIPYVHVLFSKPIDEISVSGEIKLLNKIQIIETGKRQIRNECFLKLMSSPVLIRTVTVLGVTSVTHISCVAPDWVWVSDNKNLLLTNTAGDTLHCLLDGRKSYWGVHTINIHFDLIYIDKCYNICKLSNDNRTKSTLKTRVNKLDPWIPQCVYCSLITGDLLVGMWDTNTWTGKIVRYNNGGQHIQTILYSNTGRELNSLPRCISENRNGDVVVSDLLLDAVVVTDREGKHRFSYTAPPPMSRLSPRGICTDVLSHILVCDFNTNTIHMIDKDGKFLSLILTEQHGICEPQSLSYDDKAHLLMVGSRNSNRMQKRKDSRQTGGGPPTSSSLTPLEDTVVAIDIIGDTPIDGVIGGLDTEETPISTDSSIPQTTSSTSLHSPEVSQTVLASANNSSDTTGSKNTQKREKKNSSKDSYGEDSLEIQREILKVDKERLEVEKKLLEIEQAKLVIKQQKHQIYLSSMGIVFTSPEENV
ncbi:uncharacterized protein LOC134276326 [Saccostrea cucullata]|uniref:uncharacterized protein LOC134276326 n=1 Tax=Saccostrea cuccullata TaxID=36930 RepID=UPI002ED0C1BE